MKLIDQSAVIGIDLGGTKLKLGVVQNGKVISVKQHAFFAADSEENVLKFLISCIEEQMSPAVQGIGIGVPSVVDVEEGIVYDVANIPAWKEVHLKQALEQTFNIPVYVNNDANCFVIGEKYFGKAKNYSDIVGVCLGTGLGVGLILNDRLYCGKNCGAGEFGPIAYEGATVETYCSGNFFDQFYKTSGQELCALAAAGDETALKIFAEFGEHIGKALSMIILALDPQIIIFGGTVSKAYPFFIEAAKQELQSLPYRKTVERIIIERSEIEDVAVLGAAALYYDAMVKWDCKSGANTAAVARGG